MIAAGSEHDGCCVCVLDGVGEAFAGAKVGGRLDVGGEAVGGGIDMDRQRGAASEVTQGGADSGVEPGWSYPTGEVAQLVDSDGDLSDGVVEGAADFTIGCGSEGVLGVAQGKADRHQALLRAVVEVPFDAAALVVGGSDDPGA